MTLAPRPGILDVAPYVGGEAAIPGRNRAIRLASNENPLGASPMAAAAYAGLKDELHRYPDGGAAALRQGSRPARSPPGSRNGRKLPTRRHRPGSPSRASPPHSVPSEPSPTPSQANTSQGPGCPHSPATALAWAWWCQISVTGRPRDFAQRVVV